MLVLTLSLFILSLPLPINQDVLKLYKIHFLAFPLGILFAVIFRNIKFKLNKIVKILLLTFSFLLFLYTAIHSGVGQSPDIEQNISLITTLCLIIIFSLSKFDFKLLTFFGIYSYEIYLIHWPILSRYNLLFGHLPPFLATVLYLMIFIILGYILQKIVKNLDLK